MASSTSALIDAHCDSCNRSGVFFPYICNIDGNISCSEKCYKQQTVCSHSLAPMRSLIAGPSGSAVQHQHTFYSPQLAGASGSTSNFFLSWTVYISAFFSFSGVMVSSPQSVFAPKQSTLPGFFSALLGASGSIIWFFFKVDQTTNFFASIFNFHGSDWGIFYCILWGAQSPHTSKHDCTTEHDSLERGIVRWDVWSIH